MFVTCESVTKGHPDKFCDQVSDAVLDFIISRDPTAHVAVETMATNGHIILAGEVTTTVKMDDSIYKDIVKKVIKDVGYKIEDLTSTYYDIDVYIHQQSPEIDQGVSQEDGIIGAGDQGIMYGYATNLYDMENIYLPIPYVLATKITKRLEEDVELIDRLGLRADGKSQVTMNYVDDTHANVTAVVVSCQYTPVESEDPSTTHYRVSEGISKMVMEVLSEYGYQEDHPDIYINPTGAFTMGGPACDTGLTGRKLAVDTYGGVAHHGGGALSGKDPTKVDRSGAYAARHVAKTIVAAGICSTCEVSISYAIGRAKPIHINVDSFGELNAIEEHVLAKLVAEIFDLTPAGIINELSLRSIKYQSTAHGGHFTGDYPWEDVSKSAILRDRYDHVRMLTYGI